MEENRANQQVDIIKIINRILNKKQLFAIVIIATAAIASILILLTPRYYRCSVVLAPENSTANEGLIGNVASMIGLSNGGDMSADAIYPDLYPQVLESNDFIKNLIGINVHSKDGTIATTYYNYIKQYQKSNPITSSIQNIPTIFKKLFEEKKEAGKGTHKDINLFDMTKEQSDVFGSIVSKIDCGVDMKTGLITITVQDQDPLICATITDSVRTKLQEFIIDYRTNKSRIDVEYYQKLSTEAKHAYEKARQLYGSYSDQNSDVVLQSYRLKENDLENDMQLKFNTYTVLQNQLQMAEAKLQERTPAFTVIKSATVPQTPAGPKRMVFVAMMTIFACILTAMYVNKDLIIDAFRAKN